MPSRRMTRVTWMALIPWSLLMPTLVATTSTSSQEKHDMAQVRAASTNLLPVGDATSRQLIMAGNIGLPILVLLGLTAYLALLPQILSNVFPALTAVTRPAKKPGDGATSEAGNTTAGHRLKRDDDPNQRSARIIQVIRALEKALEEFGD